MHGGKRTMRMIIIIFTVFLALTGDSAYAQLIGTIKDVETAVGSSGKVDWTPA